MAQSLFIVPLVTSVLRQLGRDLSQITRGLRLIRQAGQTSSKAETLSIA
jgi:hypothetical protein